MKFLKKVLNKFRKPGKPGLKVSTTIKFEARIGAGTVLRLAMERPDVRDTVERAMEEAGIPLDDFDALAERMMGASHLVSAVLVFPVSFSRWLQICGIDADTVVFSDCWVTGDQFATAVDILCKESKFDDAEAVVALVRQMSDLAVDGRVSFRPVETVLSSS